MYNLGNLDNSLTILLQRVNHQVSDSQYVTMSCQRTILCLLYYLEKTHKEPYVIVNTVEPLWRVSAIVDTIGTT